MRTLGILFAALMVSAFLGAAVPKEISLLQGSRLECDENLQNFSLKAKVVCDVNSEARLAFHSDSSLKGYQIVFRNGAIDGTIKTGSLLHVRNLYRSLAMDGEKFDFSLVVRGKNIEVKINGVTVVCYTEPEHPYRIKANSTQLLSHGDLVFLGVEGSVRFEKLLLEKLHVDSRNPNAVMPIVDEQTDRVIRKQQIDFPVIDYHVHLKGGLTAMEAHAKSLAYGINYGVAPNVGEGGVGRMLRDDKEAEAYLAEVKPLSFLCGVQGEGRKWPYEFSKSTLLKFDYMFVDAMTVVDGGRPLRIYRPEEFLLNGRTVEEWMEFLVNETVKILENEPSDQYANATFLPDAIASDYDRLWTDARVNRVLDVLARHSIALEINARYRIPSARIVKMAKARGLKFTFGTNNVDGNFGRLEYALDIIDECGLTKDDIWFPSMSVRAKRNFHPYNKFR